jgi:triacylglycerol lipase
MFTSAPMFTKKAALSAIQGSILAYRDEETIKECCEPAGWKIHFIESSKDDDYGCDVQLFVAEGPDECHVFFRGTEMPDMSQPFWNLKAMALDWWQNFKMSRTSWYDGEAHKGFVEEYYSIRDQLTGVLKESGKPVTIAGHSKGGALTTLCAIDCKWLNIDIFGIYTFGSPRVLDHPSAKKYKAHLGSKTYRLFHSNDIVPRTPLPFRFKHVGVPIYVRQTAGYIYNVGKWVALALRIVSYKTGDFGSDHCREAYHKSIFNHKG